MNTVVNLRYSAFLALFLTLVIGCSSTNGPASQQTTQTIFAGTGSMGIWRSTDQGNTWSASALPKASANSKPIVNFGASGSIVFASANGVAYRSTDRGNSWVTAMNGLPAEVQAFASMGKYFFASVIGYSAYRSDDSGGTWLPAKNGLQESLIYAFLPLGHSIFAATGHGVYRSDDTGNSWQQIMNGIPSEDINCLASQGNYMFAGTRDSGVFTSSDGGMTFQSASAGLPRIGQSALYSEIYSLAVSGTSIFAATYSGVYRSSDNGKTWQAVNDGLTDMKVNVLAIAGTTVYAGAASSGLFQSTDQGNTWKACTMAATSIWSLIVL